MINTEYVTCPICTKHNKLNGLPMDDCHLIMVTPLAHESCTLHFRGECGHQWEIHYRQSKGATERQERF